MNDEENDVVEIKASKANIIRGFVWEFLEKGSVQALHLVFSLILARLLSPDDYGIIALISIFVQVSLIIVTNGFKTSLVQKKDTDLLDFSSVFYFSLFLAGLLYFVLYISAPHIALFYNNVQITIVIRLVALQLFPQAICSVQTAYVSRCMQFKELFWSSLFSMVIEGVLSIGMALAGAGVWALVAQAMVSSVVRATVLFILVKWRPGFQFSFARIRKLLGFGSKMLGISLLDQIFESLYSAIIGKAYNTEILGIYNRGQQLPQVLSTNVEGAVAGVALPALSARNDDIATVRQAVRKITKGYTYIMIPCLLGVAAVAEPLTLILLSEKWAASIPYLRLFCFIYVCRTLNSVNVHALYALGKGGLVLGMQVLKKVVIIVEVIIAVRYGIMALVISQLFQGIFESFLHACLAKKVLHYTYKDQMKDIMPQLLTSIVMYILVSLVAFLKISMVFRFVIQIMAGVLIYLLVSRFLNLSAFSMCINLLREKLMEK